MLGVAGYAEEEDNWVIDPEALLLVSLTFCRYDQRLFDEILDWLMVNEKVINIQRLRTMQRVEEFESIAILSAIAALMSQTNVSPKWEKLASCSNKDNMSIENLFFLKTGQDLPVLGDNDPSFEKYGYLRNPVNCRKMSRKFPVGKPATLLLQLRSFFGLTSRAEAFLYLLLNERVEAVRLQEQSYYSIKSVRDTLAELGQSGLLFFPKSKKKRFYKIDRNSWLEMFLTHSKPVPQFVGWAAFFRLLEMVFSILDSPSFNEQSSAGQATELRQLMNEKGYDLLLKSGFDNYFQSSAEFQGEEYFVYFINEFEDILSMLSFVKERK